MTPFLGAAQRLGFTEPIIAATFDAIQHNIAHVGYKPTGTFYVYRVSDAEAEAIDAMAMNTRRDKRQRPTKPRYLMAFPSPDDALVFARQQGITPFPPPLAPLVLAQLLTVLLNSPAIAMLIFSEEDAPPSTVTHIPTRYSLERHLLFGSLKGEITL